MSTGNASDEVSALLVQGFKAAKENHRDEAYNIFCDVVRRDPNNELGWLYRAATTDDLSEAYVCLQRVLSLNPDNEKAQRGIERIQARLNSEDDSSGGGARVYGAPIQADTSPRLGEDNVVSGFSSRPNPPSFNQDTVPTGGRGIYDAPPQEADTRSFSFDQPQSFTQGNVPDDFTNQGAYRPDFNASSPFQGQGRDDQQTNNFNPTPYRDTPPPEDYSGYYGQNDGSDTLVDEPIQPSGPNRNRVRSGRTAPASEPTDGNRRGRKAGAGLAPVFNGMAGVRNRSRAALGTETATGLDQVGRERARRVQMRLLIIGIVLFLIAIVVLILLLPNLNKNNATQNGDQVAASATQTASSATGPTSSSGLTVGSVSVGSPVSGSPGAVISAPVVGGVTSGTGPGQTTPPAPAQTTVPGLPGTQPPGQTTAPVQPATNPPPPAQTTAPAPPAGAAQRPVVYAIKSGDALERVARQYGTTTAAVVAANAITNPNNVKIGTQLVIPVGRPDFRGRSAILKQGEVLQTLADRFKVSLDDIVRLNGFANPDDVRPGDGVLIP